MSLPELVRIIQNVDTQIKKLERGIHEDDTAIQRLITADQPDNDGIEWHNRNTMDLKKGIHHEKIFLAMALHMELGNIIQSL